MTKNDRLEAYAKIVEGWAKSLGEQAEALEAMSRQMLAESRYDDTPTFRPEAFCNGAVRKP